MTLHIAAAAVLKTPELALEEKEAETFAKAVCDLEAAFPTNIDPRVFAVMNFAGVAAMIYGPRIAAIRFRMYAEKRERKASEPAPEFQPTIPAGAFDPVDNIFNPKPMQ